MNIVSGQLPDGAAWRVLLYIDPEHPAPQLWQLGLSLARANDGEMVPFVLLHEDEAQAVEQPSKEEEKEKDEEKEENEQEEP